MLVLASASPRRQSILKNAGYVFDVFAAKGEELLISGKPEKAALELAKAKAFEVSAELKRLKGSEAVSGMVFLSADTIVVLNNEIMGKPVDEAEAVGMLKALSGKRHTVITAVCILREDTVRLFFGKTSVEFFELSDNDISMYVKSGDCYDKAGAYGIQEKGAFLVKGIRGDFYNVMGLPLAKTARELKNFGIKPQWQ